jgi:hypothetical protein
MAAKKVTQVTGFLKDRLWKDQTNEAHGQIIMRFENGAVANPHKVARMSLPMPCHWRIRHQRRPLNG